MGIDKTSKLFKIENLHHPEYGVVSIWRPVPRPINVMSSVVLDDNWAIKHNDYHNT